MTGLKRTLSAIAFCSAFVLAAILLMSNTVYANEENGKYTLVVPEIIDLNAEEDHGVIQSGKPVKIDLESAWKHWFKYTPTGKQVIKIESTGDVDVRFDIHEGSKTGDVIIEDDNSGPGSNFLWMNLIEKGTYWINVYPHNFGTDVSVNNTEVIFTVFPQTKITDIDETSFPDPVFRDYVLENIDFRKDGKLSYDEMILVKIISLKSLNVYDIKGVELFSELEELYCNSCALNSFNFTGMQNLKKLYCRDNKYALGQVTVSDCPNLKSLTVYNCKASSLSISGCESISDLSCSYNQITDLDVSNLPDLYYLGCDSNQIKSLNFDGCSNLNRIDCHYNYLESLDVSALPYFETLYCMANKLTSLKLNKKIDSLYCNGNELSSLDLSGLTKLMNLNCAYNSITKLDISSSMYLCSIYPGGWDETKGLYKGSVKGYTCQLGFDDNVKVTSADSSEFVVDIDEKHFPDSEFRSYVSKNFDLNHDDKLDKLEIAAATSVDLYNKDAATLKGVEYFTELERIYCPGNQLSSLDISKNKKLSILVCSSNNLKELDISDCPLLIKAYKEGNKTVTETVIKYEKKPEYNYIRCDKTLKIIVAKPTPTPTATPTATAKPTAKPTSASSASLSLDKKTASVVCGKTLTLKATLKGSSSKITWKSSNTKVATVDSKGKVTAAMAGEVTITATAAGKSAKCTVTVLYKDVTNSKDFWFAPTNYLTAKGVVKGYDNQTKFKPANKCTRAQMVTFIWRLQGEPNPKATTCKFKDVKKTDYFYKACIWGNENKIVEGYKDGTFGPQIVCARKHAVTFLWRLAGKPTTKTTKNPFKDVKKTDYFYKATIWASEKKILAGYSDGTFRPNGDCLRRQMVTFLYKYDKVINKKG